MNKRIDRLIYSISSVFCGYDYFKEIAIKQKSLVIGIIIFLTSIGLAIMWFDFSGIIRKKLIKTIIQIIINTLMFMGW